MSPLSFAATTKKELTLINDSEPCCEKAELSAFIRMNGSVQLTSQRVVLGYIHGECSYRTADILADQEDV